MDDKLKYWTSVGSAGTLNQTDLAKVSLHQSIVQLGAEIAQPATAQAAEAQALGILPTVQAVVRYNVTPVDGLFFTGQHAYTLQLRCRGNVSAKLIQVDLASGAETTRILLTSTAPAFHVQQAFENPPWVQMDFVHKAYYVEATLTAPALVVGHPAAISIVKIFPAVPLQ